MSDAMGDMFRGEMMHATLSLQMEDYEKQKAAITNVQITFTIAKSDALELRLLLQWVKQNSGVRYLLTDCEWDRRKAHFVKEQNMQTERELRRGVEVLERILK